MNACANLRDAATAGCATATQAYHYCVQTRKAGVPAKLMHRLHAPRRCSPLPSLSLRCIWRRCHHLSRPL